MFSSGVALLTHADQRFRPWAHARIQEFRDQAEHAKRRTALGFLAKALGSPEVPSFLLPVNGQYVDRNTPATHTGGDFGLPFREVMLEYSMSEAGFYSGVPKGSLKPSTMLIWIAQMSMHSAVIFPVYRTSIDGDADWVPPPFGLIFGDKTHLSNDDKGMIRLERISVQLLTSKTPSERQISQLIRDYSDELRVLLHFSTLCQSTNVGMRCEPWPPAIGPDGKPLRQENYYTLTCTGPTPLRWLPTAGMPLF
jgi:hypothetical protein